jgi:hypothetical protein
MRWAFTKSANANAMRKSFRTTIPDGCIYFASNWKDWCQWWIGTQAVKWWKPHHLRFFYDDTCMNIQNQSEIRKSLIVSLKRYWYVLDYAYLYVYHTKVTMFK